jgi:hypothetical protein
MQIAINLILGPTWIHDDLIVLDMQRCGSSDGGVGSLGLRQTSCCRVIGGINGIQPL